MNLLLGTAVIVLCLVIQVTVAGAALRYYDRNAECFISGSLFTAITVLVAVMVLLLLGNLVQIWIWALLFQWLGEFQGISEAYYHSAVNFATLGYGDIVMSESHRILGPLQAVNGVLMIGLTTAVLMLAIQDSRTKRYQGSNDPSGSAGSRSQ